MLAVPERLEFVPSAGSRAHFSQPCHCLSTESGNHSTQVDICNLPDYDVRNQKCISALGLPMASVTVLHAHCLSEGTHGLAAELVPPFLTTGLFTYKGWIKSSWDFIHLQDVGGLCGLPILRLQVSCSSFRKGLKDASSSLSPFPIPLFRALTYLHFPELCPSQVGTSFQQVPSPLSRMTPSTPGPFLGDLLVVFLHRHHFKTNPRLIPHPGTAPTTPP